MIPKKRSGSGSLALLSNRHKINISEITSNDENKTKTENDTRAKDKCAASRPTTANSHSTIISKISNESRKRNASKNKPNDEHEAKTEKDTTASDKNTIPDSVTTVYNLVDFYVEVIPSDPKAKNEKEESSSSVSTVVTPDKQPESTDVNESKPNITKKSSFEKIADYFNRPLTSNGANRSPHSLVTCKPSLLVFNFVKGGLHVQQLRITNATLDAVYVKVIRPDAHVRLSFMNYNPSDSKRIPAGLTFNMGLIFDGTDCEKSFKSTLLVIAARKLHVKFSQVCHVDLEFNLRREKSTTSSVKLPIFEKSYISDY